MPPVSTPTPPTAFATRIRRLALEAIAKAGSGHPGGSLSIADILATLYGEGVLRHRPREPGWPDRDRLVLSKGHGCPALYAAIALAGGADPATLTTLRKLDSPFQGHPDRRKWAAMEASTGSLGQGLSLAIGMALGQRAAGKGARTYCILGDGECQEGQVWEAAMLAPHLALDNLCAIVDFNKIQLDDHCAKILEVEPFADKWRAFGWDTVELDGHDPLALSTAFARFAGPRARKPLAIVAHTVKGKGVSFMEDAPKWHGIAPSADELKKALAELEGATR